MEGKHYKTNKTHTNAWCLIELRLEMELLRQADNKALAEQVITSAQTEEQLLANGESI
jgi:hypothetical protein